jgi:hypothetical protein
MRIFCPAIASSVSLSSYRLLVADPVAFRPPRSGVSHPLRAARAGAGSHRSRRSIGSPSGPVACASLSSPRTVRRAEPLQGRRCRHWSSPRVKQPVHSARGRRPDPNRAPLPPAGAPTRRRHAGTSVVAALGAVLQRGRTARADGAAAHELPPGGRRAVAGARLPGRVPPLPGGPGASHGAQSRRTAALTALGRDPDSAVGPGHTPGPHRSWISCAPPERDASDHLLILVTRPAPTVRPPSRMANLSPSSMAMGWIRSTVISVLSPGMTISVPSGSFTTPVTSVVRK